MKKKILIVEDESSLQNAMKEFLIAEGFEAIVADDGEMAIKLIKKEKPDLVMLDIVLPKKDGFEVLAELKSDSSLEDIPVMLLTNLEDASSVEKAFSLGVNTYLVKSNYRMSDIVAKVRMMLRNC
jgi:DNA-binding response OmpR family regulator